MKSFMILGLGRFGVAIAETLYNLGNEVLVMDKNAEVINEISERVTHAVIGDICDENTLRSIGARNFDVVVLASAGSMEVSIMATMVLKEIGVKYLAVKAHDSLHAKILLKIGADKVFMPEHDMGVRVAHTLVRGDFLDFIELSADYSIGELSVPEHWHGKTMAELNVRSGYGINVLAVKNGNTINPEPAADYVFKKGDVIAVVGSNKKLAKLK